MILYIFTTIFCQNDLSSLTGPILYWSSEQLLFSSEFECIFDNINLQLALLALIPCQSKVNWVEVSVFLFSFEL